jgi:hypothetical protein
MADGGVIQGQARWGVPGDWSSGNIPIANSDAIVPGTLGNSVTDAGGDAEGIDLDVLITHSGFKRGFGTSGTPINCIADLIHVMGAGGFYMQANGAALILDELRIEPSNPAAIVQIGSTPAAQGKILRSHIGSGNVEFMGNAEYSATAHMVLGTVPWAQNTKLKVNNGDDTLLADFIQTAGESWLHNVVTRMAVANGTCWKEDNKAVTIDVYAGGVVNYNHQAVAGEVLMVRIHTGGMFDLTQSGFQKVIDTIIVLRGGTLKKNDSMHTFTNPVIYLDTEG